VKYHQSYRDSEEGFYVNKQIIEEKQGKLEEQSMKESGEEQTYH